jgi:hypothetical protein
MKGCMWPLKSCLSVAGVEHVIVWVRTLKRMERMRTCRSRKKRKRSRREVKGKRRR